MKFLDLETVGLSVNRDQKKEYQTDFMKEAKVASLIRHDSVVRVIDFGEFERLPYLVMEYVPGPSLLKQITQRGRYTVSDATKIARKIAGALDAFHERQLVHRDLKPANVIMDPRGEGRLTLVDLGPRQGYFRCSRAEFNPPDGPARHAGISGAGTGTEMGTLWCRDSITRRQTARRYPRRYVRLGRDLL